jgi:hypothetical protein
MDPVGIVILGALAGATAIWAWRVDRRRKRALPDSPVVTVRGAKPGMFVRIVGTVVDGKTMLAPITGRECVCFSAAAKGIEELPTGPRPRDTTRRWHPLAERVGANPFVLEDGTGRIAVDPRGAIIRLALDHHVTVKRGEALPLHEAGFVSTTLQLEEIILDEGVVPNGARVVVEAMVQAMGAGPELAAYRRGDGDLFLAGGASRSPSISDLPGDLEGAGAGLGAGGDSRESSRGCTVM